MRTRIAFTSCFLPILLLLMAACQRRFELIECFEIPADVDLPDSPEWRAHDSGLKWLQSRQGPDGFWGENDDRRILTSFALLAFLHAGHTPASAEYGKTVAEAIKALVLGIPEMNTDDELELTVTIWALESAYEMTSNILIHQALLPLYEFLPENPSVFWRAMLKDGREFRVKYRPADPEGSPAHAVHALDRAFQTKPHDFPSARTTLANLSAKRFDILKTSANPMQTWLVLAMAIRHAPHEHYREWASVYFDIFTQRQLRADAYGWWTAESLGLVSEEIPRLQGQSRDLWITSVMLITFPPFRFICPICVEEAWRNADPDDVIHIKL